MSTSDYELATPPSDPRALELWLQHAAGFILFENARRYAFDRLASNLSTEARTAAEKAIDDAIGGVMQIFDGISFLKNDDLEVQLAGVVRLLDRKRNDAIRAEIDLFHGDGMCMGFHMWKENDFGKHPIVVS